MSGEDAELRQRDARARRLAQEEFERPFVLEAGAGTGKTTALVARILAWILGPGWERASAELGGRGPEAVARRTARGVVAITFARAAAAEMGTRLGAALHVVERGELPLGLLEESLPGDGDARIARARALRGALGHLLATTIDAWCRRLLLAHPLDAGLHARLEIDADGRLRQEIVRELLDPRLRDAYAAGEPRLLALAERGVGPREIELEILALLEAGLPSRSFRSDPFSDERVAELVGRLERALAAACQAAQPLASLRRATRSLETREALERSAARLAERPVGSRAALAELARWLDEELEAPLRSRLSQWAAGRFGKEEEGALGPEADALTEAARDLVPLVSHLRAIDVERLDLARSVFGDLLAEVEEELRVRGVATFHDLVDGAARLLGGNREVAAQEAARIDQLLVDEFQDTDLRQCELLRALALPGPSGLRPGLFVVGDPKQSIYGWRSADLTAYDSFVEEVVAAGGLRETLHVNHRSVGRVLAEVERVVAPVMRERRGIQPRFEPLVPSPEHAEREGFAEQGRRPAEYWVSAAWDSETGAPRQPCTVSEASRVEARALARELLWLQRQGHPWRSAGVLFRTRSDWDLYLAVLREHRIPFAVEGDRSYYRRREIVDAAAWVRCVLDPNDQLALLTLLRSAAVGVPDAALIPLWARDLPRLLQELEEPDAERMQALRACAEQAAADLPEGVPGLERVAGWERSLCAFGEALAALRRSARQDAVDVFVEKLRTSLLLEASEAARYQGVWRLANLDRFFRDLLADLDAGVDFHRVLRRLRAAVAEEQDAQEGRPREILGDAVQIMTIHGAKGLDFEHVFLMQLHKGRPPRRVAQVEQRSVEGRLEYCLLGAPTSGWDRAERERLAVEEAESVRSLYVAMTRARQRVVLVGLWPAFARTGSGRIIDLVAEGVAAAGAPDLEAQAGRGEHAQLDAAGARWVFPALDPAPPDSADAVAPELALPGAEAIAADSRRLAAARAEARARMGLPLGMAASDEPAGDGEERAARLWSSGSGAGPEGDEAAAVGTAIHRALELFDFTADPGAELARARSLVTRILEAELPSVAAGSAVERAEALLSRFAGGRLLARLRELSPHIVARELPVLLAPEPGEGAVGYVAGALDLVYADPENGRLVVADYKTGARRDHSAQGARYVRALRQALALDYDPRFELWLLAEDERVPA